MQRQVAATKSDSKLLIKLQLVYFVNLPLVGLSPDLSKPLSILSSS